MVIENPLALEMGTTDSPLETTGPKVDIEAALKAGTLTEAQAIVLQERLRKEMEAKIATLEERLGGQAAPIGAAIRSVLASLTEAPTNWHQGVVCGLVSSSPAHELHRWAPLGCLVSATIVAMQCAVAVVLVVGTVESTCANNDQCAPGTFCAPERDLCFYCGEDVPPGIREIIHPAYGLYWDESLFDHRRENPPEWNPTRNTTLGLASACGAPDLETRLEEESQSWTQSPLTLLAWCDMWCEIALLVLVQLEI